MCEIQQLRCKSCVLEGAYNDFCSGSNCEKETAKCHSKCFRNSGCVAIMYTVSWLGQMGTGCVFGRSFVFG